MLLNAPAKRLVGSAVRAHCRARVAAVAFAVLVSVPAHSQTITTVVGRGGFGFCGDGQNALDACLKNPWTVIFDQVGNMFIADYVNHRVRKVDTSGIITTVAGNGTPAYCGDDGLATDACLHYPSGLAFDAAGNLLIADAFNHRIRKVDTLGFITTVAGNGTMGYCGDDGFGTDACLHQPQGVAVDASGTLFIADSMNHRIRTVDTTGMITTVAGNGTESFCGDNGSAPTACLAFPLGVTLLPAGGFLIADYRNQRIRQVDAVGTITTVAGNGIGDYCGDGGLATNACLHGPTSVALDGDGSVFIADTHNHRVRKVDPGGKIVTVTGNGQDTYCGDDGPASSACVSQPSGVTLDAAGSLLIGDYGNHRVRRISAAMDTACAYSFGSGAGASRVSYCVSETGTIGQLGGPAGQEHVRVGEVWEGYVVCVGGAVHAWDLSGSASGFGDTVVTSGPTGTGIGLRRSSALFQLDQVFRLDKKEKDVTITMTLRNIGASAAIDVRLVRAYDPDLNSDFGDDLEVRSTRSVWAGDADALTLSGITWNLPTDAAIDTGSAPACSPSGATSPRVTGDGTLATLTYRLGNIAAGAQKKVAFAYRIQ